MPTSSTPLRCAACHALIPTASVNISEGVAQCPGCGNISRLSTLVPGQQPSGSGGYLASFPPLPKPPECKEFIAGDSLVLSAPTSSPVQAFILLLASLFFNSVVFGIFGIALSGGAAGSGASGALGGAVCASLFLSPFMVAGLAMISWLLLLVFGRIETSLSGDELKIFTGVGRFGRTKRLMASRYDGARVTMQIRRYRDDEDVRTRTACIIELTGPAPHLFGSMLKQHRMEWLADALGRRLAAQSKRA